MVASAEPGVVQGVDVAALARLAGSADGEVEVLRAVGEFVPAGAAMFRVRDQDRLRDQRLRAAVTLGEERSMDQDVGFGLRQLVDIAARALSPGINARPPPCRSSTNCTTCCGARQLDRYLLEPRLACLGSSAGTKSSRLFERPELRSPADE